MIFHTSYQIFLRSIFEIIFWAFKDVTINIGFFFFFFFFHFIDDLRIPANHSQAYLSPSGEWVCVCVGGGGGGGGVGGGGGA